MTQNKENEIPQTMKEICEFCQAYAKISWPFSCEKVSPDLIHLKTTTNAGTPVIHEIPYSKVLKASKDANELCWLKSELE